MAINRNRPNIATLKSVLDRSKESSKFSPYPTKEEEPIKVKPEKVETAPTPIPEPATEQISADNQEVVEQAPVDTPAAAVVSTNTETPVSVQDAKQEIQSTIDDQGGGGGGDKGKKNQPTNQSQKLSKDVRDTVKMLYEAQKRNPSQFQTPPAKSNATSNITYTITDPKEAARQQHEYRILQSLGVSKEKFNEIINYTAYSKYGTPKTQQQEADYQRELRNRILNGELTIDKNRIVYPDNGAVSEAMNSFLNFFTSIPKGIDYTTKSDKEKTNHLETEYQKSLTDFPKQTEHPIANMVGTGGAGAITTIGIGAAYAGLGIGEVGTVGLGTPIILPLATGLTYTAATLWNDVYNKEQEAYFISRQNGADVDKAYAAAKAGRPVYYTTTAGINLLSSMIGLRTTGAYSSVINSASGQSAKHILSALGKTTLTRIPEIGANTGLATLAKVADDLSTQKNTGVKLDIGHRALEVAEQSLATNAAFALIPTVIKGGATLVKNKILKNAVINHLNNLDKTWVDNELIGMKQKGLISEEQYNKTKSDIDEYQKLKSSLPFVGEEEAPTAVGLMLKLKNLEYQATQLNVDDPYRGHLDVEIQKTKQQIQDTFNGKKSFDVELDEFTSKPLNEIENATTTALQSEQASETTGDISKYQGVESEQAQKTNEADNSNSVISGQAQKIKQPQWVTKLFGVIPADKVTVNEKTALKRFLKGQQDAANGAVKWVKTARQDISNGLTELVGAGKIKTTQLQSILKKYDSLNLTNKVHVEKFTEYVSNVINDATYAEGLSRANSIKSKISGMSKNKNLQTNISAAAKEFLSINPADVSDLPAYMAKANEVYEGISRPAKTKEGAKFAQAFDEKSVLDYINGENELITRKNKESRMAEYQELVDEGIITNDMSFDNMETIINEIEKTGKTNASSTKKNSIRAYVNKRIEDLSNTVDNILTKGEDGLGNKIDVNLTPNDRRIIQGIIKSTAKDMPIEDAYRTMNALDNFIVNGKHSGLEKPLHSYYGVKNAEYASKQYKAFAMNGISRKAYDLTGTLPLLFKNLFGVNDVKVMKAMGYTDYYKAMQKTNFEMKSIGEEFENLFGKTKPNGLNFYDADNITEMGLYSHLLRNAGGTPEQIADEFSKRINIFKGSIENLKKSTNADKKKLAEYYEKAKIKLLDGAKNIEDVKARMDKTNIEAVEWWINKWDEKFPDMQELAKNYYNKKLRKDNNYTPDVHRKVKKGKIGVEANDENWEDGFTPSSTDFFPASESSTLKEANLPSEIGEDNYISLDFLSDMNSRYRQSLRDLYGSKYIAQMKSFINSPTYNKLFKDVADADILAGRVKSYANRTRGNYGAQDENLEWGSIYKGLTQFNKITTGATLGGPRQFFQQLTPMVNAFFQTGRITIKDVMINKDIQNIINTSNRDIALTTYEGDVNFKPSNEYMKSMLSDKKGPGNWIVKQLDNASSLWLKTTLQFGDKIARRAGWWAFYVDHLSKNGTDVENVDWSTHTLDDAAADYAQQMVNTTQNVVQTELKGFIASSKNQNVALAKQTFMPLSDFMLNQKLSFWSNMTRAVRPSASVQDRMAALTGVAGILVEAVAFNAVKHGFAYGYDWAADVATDYKPTEKEKEERERRRDAASASNITLDLAPLPPQLNTIAAKGTNAILQKIYDLQGTPPPEELRVEIESFKSKNVGADAGLFGIGLTNIQEIVDLMTTANTGTVEKTINNNEEEYKLMDEKDKKTAAIWGGINILNSLGILPADAGNIANSVMRRLKQKAISEEKFEEFKLTKDEAKNFANLPVIDGKNVWEAYAYSIGIKDPMAKGKYLADVYNKYGEESFETIVAASKAPDTETSIKKKYPITNKDYFMTKSILSKDNDRIDIANALSYRTPEAVAYKLFEKRKDMKNLTDFYRNIGAAMQLGAISKEEVFLYAQYVKDKMPYYEDDIELLNMFFNASDLKNQVPLKERTRDKQ